MSREEGGREVGKGMGRKIGKKSYAGRKRWDRGGTKSRGRGGRMGKEGSDIVT